ncbi:MAG: A/G-specific adenine glycosylase [Methylococcaceae bacterium]|nr:MAG: A/G-specific adenine glycosylase [Methylococcaceae bacterium]
MPNPAFAAKLLAWYDQHGRKDLPWRQNPTPYRVWLAEIMLQQTQVATVLPYYQRFLQRFPNIANLGGAPLEDVLGHWAGLGYYSRARHLHRTAQIILTEYHGLFPDTLAGLTALPGVGRSTAGAILAIAFGLQASILDGNVKRVLARFGGIAGDPGTTTVNRQLWELSASLTPALRTDDYTQAIMDLGAIVCTRSKPLCPGCPMADECIALQQNRIAQLPGKRAGKALPTRKCWFLLLRDPAGRVYLEQKPAPGLWGGLWCFPEFADWDDLQLAAHRRRADSRLEPLPSGRHTFSHYHLHYTPVLASCSGVAEWVADGGHSRWADPVHDNPPMPTPIQRLYNQLRE